MMIIIKQHITDRKQISQIGEKQRDNKTTCNRMVNKQTNQKN